MTREATQEKQDAYREKQDASREKQTKLRLSRYSNLFLRVAVIYLHVLQRYVYFKSFIFNSDRCLISAFSIIIKETGRNTTWQPHVRFTKSS